MSFFDSIGMLADVSTYNLSRDTLLHGFSNRQIIHYRHEDLGSIPAPGRNVLSFFIRNRQKCVYFNTYPEYLIQACEIEPVRVQMSRSVVAGVRKGSRHSPNVS